MYELHCVLTGVLHCVLTAMRLQEEKATMKALMRVLPSMPLTGLEGRVLG